MCKQAMCKVNSNTHCKVGRSILQYLHMQSRLETGNHTISGDAAYGKTRDPTGVCIQLLLSVHSTAMHMAKQERSYRRMHTTPA